MSYIKCLLGKIDVENLRKGDIKKIQLFHDQEVEKFLKKSLDDASLTPQQQKAAADAATERFAQLLETRRRQAAIHIKKTKDIASLLSNHVAFKDNLHGLMHRANVTQKSIAEIHRRLAADFFLEYQPTWLGTKGKTEGLDDIVQALFGNKVKSKDAQRHANQLREMLNTIHRDYNAKGGRLDFVEDYMPVMWMDQKVKAVSKDEFVGDMKAAIRADRVDDEDQIDMFLSKVYETLSSNGLNKQDANVQNIIDGKSTKLRGVNFSERKNYRKQIYFNTGQDYLNVMEKYGFGKDNFYEMINNYIDRMAMDIGVLDTFGPRPHDIKKLMRQLNEAAKNAPGGKAVRDQTINGYVDLLTGVQFSKDADTFLTKAFNVLLPLNRAALMGSAVISAFGDSAFVASTKRLNGLSATSAVKSILSSFNPAKSKADREMLQNIVNISEIAHRNLMNEMDRFSGYKGKFDALTNLVINASGLGAWTRRMSEASGKMLGMNVYAMRSQRFETLDPVFRKSAQEWGIDAADWDKIKTVTPYIDELNGITTIRPFDVAKKHGTDLALKLQNWETHIRQQGTNEPTIKTLLISSGAGLGSPRQNSAASILSRSFFMLKAFPLTVMQTHLQGSLRKLGWGPGMMNIGGTLLSATLLYAMAYQARHILAGKTPEDWDNPKFWGQAMVGSGGLGLFGDVLFKNYNGFGTTLLGELQGPVVGLGENVISNFYKNMDKAFKGEDTNLIADMARTGRRILPGQNLWYFKAAMNYGFDALEDFLDDEGYNERQKRLEKIMDERGQEFWFKYGE